MSGSQNNTDPLSPDYNPPIFKYLHARDRSILKEAARIRAEQDKEKQEKASNMSASEQTYVFPNPIGREQKVDFSVYSFIAIKPDGVQVCQLPTSISLAALNGSPNAPHSPPPNHHANSFIPQRGLVGDIISRFEKRGCVYLTLPTTIMTSVIMDLPSLTQS